MGRFFTPTVESIGPGPSVQAAGDGLEGHYTAILNSVPSGGKCNVVVPGLDPLHHMVAKCPANASGSVGDEVFVGFDDQKSLWVVTPSSPAPVLDSALKRGSVTITWSGSTAASVSITHGLGHVPSWFSLTLALSGQVAYLQATSVTSSVIAVNGQAAATLTGSGTVYWAAL